MRAMAQIIAAEAENHSQLYKDIIEIERSLKKGVRMLLKIY